MLRQRTACRRASYCRSKHAAGGSSHHHAPAPEATRSSPTVGVSPTCSSIDDDLDGSLGGDGAMARMARSGTLGVGRMGDAGTPGGRDRLGSTPPSLLGIVRTWANCGNALASGKPQGAVHHLSLNLGGKMDMDRTPCMACH